MACELEGRQIKSIKIHYAHTKLPALGPSMIGSEVNWRDKFEGM